MARAQRTPASAAALLLAATVISLYVARCTGADAFECADDIDGGSCAAIKMAGEAKPEIPSLTLNNGARMPQLGLGTWLSKPGEVKAAVIAALDAGYRHIDCAAAYGNEKEVGEGIADAIGRGVVTRDQIFVTSKLPPSNMFVEHAVPTLESTLSDLGLDYLDLYLLHWPMALRHGSGFPPAPEDRLGYDAANVAAVWAELEKQVAAGRVKALGVSNFSVRKIHELLKTATVPVSVNQVEAHVALPQQPLLDYCQLQGIVLTAYSPLGNPGRPAAMIDGADPVPMSDELVVKMAETKSITPAQLLLAWAVRRGTVAIPKSTNPGRIAANLKGGAKFTVLSDDDMKALAALDAGAKGRLLKGEFITPPDMEWQGVWEDDAADLERLVKEASEKK